MDFSMIRIGVAGWDYPDWKGMVYPQTEKRSFDRLAYISRYVDVVEINSSFYRPVSPRVAESWVQRTAAKAGFRFTAKSHRSWTHEPAADLRESVARTLTGLDPLRQAGMLGALLVQFPQSFHYSEGSRERIDSLIELAPEWPLVIEVRHASWEEREALDWFPRCGAGWCVVDQPVISDSTTRATPRVSGPVGYLRLHGRNRADWFRPDAGRDARYDYLYAGDEMAELAGAARTMAAKAEELFIVQNNHFRGQALVNALQIKRLLQNSWPPAPQELVLAYPQLEDEVEIQRTRLF
jgi:uncharacterized protein YecE (DUF72 family)